MRNTNCKLFRKNNGLHIIHNELDIVGIAKNEMVIFSRVYYKDTGKGASEKQMYGRFRELRDTTMPFLSIAYSWSVQREARRIVQSYREMKTLGRGRPKIKSCKKHKGMTFPNAHVKFREVLPVAKGQRNHPTYEIQLNGNWYRFALTRAIDFDKVKQVHVHRDALGDVYITISEDVIEKIPEPKTGHAAGFDFGIKDGKFLISSDGYIEVSPMFYKQDQKKLAKAQREHSRKVIGSNNSERARLDVCRVHKKTKNRRTDHHWKTAIKLCRKYDLMFFEDLNIAGMKKLWGKIISDISFSAFLLKLRHQACKRDKDTFKIGRWEATTQKCCACDYQNKELTLDDREWTCPVCHTHLDRDLNAAVNILKVGVATYALGVVRPVIEQSSLVGCTVGDHLTEYLLNSTKASA